MTAPVLIYGYGNPGRQDDGLGPELVRELRARDLGPCAAFESGYQLQIEDAVLVAQHRVVVFADADATGPAPFSLRPIPPDATAAFTTHAVAPQTILALARQHFGPGTAGFALGIRGYAFDGFGEQLSPLAQRNLVAAADYLAQALRDGTLGQAAVPADLKGESDVRG